MGRVARQIGLRLSQGLFVALGVSTIIFVILATMPGDLATKVALARYGEDGLDRGRVELVREETGLGSSLPHLYIGWLGGVLRFDFGHSMVTGEPVSRAILFHLRMSFLLALTGLGISLFIAVPMGIVAGLKPGSPFDLLSALFASVIVSVPSFVLGACLIIVFSIRLRLLPAAGFFTTTSIILPSITLGLALAAVSSRVIRTAVVDVKETAYIGFARLKGLSGIRVFCDHGLRNGAIPVVTFLALQFAHVLDGVVVIENLFNWPGVGVLLLESIRGRDLAMIQGVTMVIGFIYVALNLAADLICVWLDPRQLEGRRGGL